MVLITNPGPRTGTDIFLETPIIAAFGSCVADLYLWQLRKTKATDNLIKQS